MLSEKEYRELPREEYFSSSFIKEFEDVGPQCLVKPKVYSNSGMTFGSLADLLLLTSEEFNNDYHITKFKSEFSPIPQKLFDILANVVSNNGLEEKDIEEESDIYITLCFEIIKTEGLWATTKDREKLKKHFLSEDFKGSLLDKIKAKTKKLVTTEDYLNAQLMAKIIKEHEFTKDYILSDDLSKKQILFQTAVLYEYRGNKYKSLMDIIVLDHENKTARVVDYKTGARPNNEFQYSFFQFGYDKQSGLYTLALSKFLEKKGFKDYKILNPAYIYVCRSTPELPLVFMIPSIVISNAFTGYETKSGTKVKGIHDLVDDILWHRKHDKYDYSREIYEKGYQNISSSFIRPTLVPNNDRPDITNYTGENFLTPDLLEMYPLYSEGDDGIVTDMSSTFGSQEVNQERLRAMVREARNELDRTRARTGEQFPPIMREGRAPSGTASDIIMRDGIVFGTPGQITNSSVEAMFRNPENISDTAGRPTPAQRNRRGSNRPEF